MVIVWRGLGWLVAVIVFCLSLVANFLFNAVYGDGYYDHHKWPVALSLIASGIVCWFVGHYLKTRSDRIAIDKQTGQEIVINQSRHALFFVPMHLWGIILPLIASILLTVELLHL